MKQSAWRDTIDAQVQYAPASLTGRPVEDAAGKFKLIGIPVNLSGKDGHDQDFEIENERPVVDIV
jgi:hypothetical protein